MATVYQIPDSDKELLFYFKEIILYFERVVAINPKGYRSQRKVFVDFLKKEKISFIYMDTKSITVPDSYKTFKEAFVIIKRARNYSRFASFLYHMRNSFAHDHFYKMRIGNTIFLGLEDHNDKGLSMVAQIPIKRLNTLLDIIKQSKDNL